MLSILESNTSILCNSKLGAKKRKGKKNLATLKQPLELKLGQFPAASLSINQLNSERGLIESLEMGHN